MSKWKYPLLGIDEISLGKAVLKNVDVSVRDLYNVCRAVRGMKVSKAKEYLNRVLEGKESIPFYRYTKGTGHRGDISKKWKIKQGRYPKKAVKYVLKAIEAAENNAINKGMESDSLKIVHMSAHKGFYIKRFTPRAFGRATEKNKARSHIEVIVRG
ncbi:50S ribosomal protein L22 [Sulfolobales archaeon HS-7]|nr:50S ribosomal protein L22 [Sulfolobales archaeon HS-7]